MLWLLAMRGLHGASDDAGDGGAGTCPEQGLRQPVGDAAPCDVASPTHGDETG